MSGFRVGSYNSKVHHFFLDYLYPGQHENAIWSSDTMTNSIVTITSTHNAQAPPGSMNLFALSVKQFPSSNAQIIFECK